MEKTRKLVVALIVGTLMVFFGGVAATASGGSDSYELPYLVDNDGITLTDGSVFEDGGHVNIKTNQGSYGIHFEKLNNQPSGKWIGKKHLPWSAFGIPYPHKLCVTWVQVWKYNEHFGEHRFPDGTTPVIGKGCKVPTPTPTPTTEPTETPTPTPEPTETPTPTPEPTETPTTEPSVGPTPQHHERTLPNTGGSPAGAVAMTITAFAFILAGLAGMIARRKRA